MQKERENERQRERESTCFITVYSHVDPIKSTLCIERSRSFNSSLFCEFKFLSNENSFAFIVIHDDTEIWCNVLCVREYKHFLLHSTLYVCHFWCYLCFHPTLYLTSSLCFSTCVYIYSHISIDNVSLFCCFFFDVYILFGCTFELSCCTCVRAHL